METWTAYIWIIVMIALFYFMLIRPQKKKEKADRMMRNKLQPGDDIVTIGGFTGRVLNVKDDLVTFETGAAKTKLTIKKWAIQSRISSGDEDENQPEALPESGKEQKNETNGKTEDKTDGKAE